MAQSRSSIAPWLLAAAGYAGLILLFTWPLALRLTSVLPHDPGDPLFGAYLFWWNAHSMPLTDAWWNAPFFWPVTGALGLSEHLLGFAFVSTPLQWVGADPIAAYNIAFLLSFPLSALAMHALAFKLTGRHDAAALAGLIYAFSPYRSAQVAHIQMLWTFWMPVALLALHEYASDGRARRLVLFCAMWLGQALSNGYYLLFFPVLVACWVVWFLASRGDLRRAVAVAAVGVLGSMPLIPILIGYQQIQERFALQRSLGEVRLFSADVMALITTAPWQWAWSWLSKTRGPEQELFPGITAPVLIVAAVILSFRLVPGARSPYSRTRTFLAAASVVAAALAVSSWAFGASRIAIGDVTLLSFRAPSKPLTNAIWLMVIAVALSPRMRRAWTKRSVFVFYVLAAVLMYVCSFGPEPTFAGEPFWYKPPYSWLMELPGFSGIRVPSRFATLGTLCLAVAAALALTRLAGRLSPRANRLAGVGACALALVDGSIAGLPLADIPRRIPALESNIASTAVVELPLGDVMDDLQAVYRSIYHGRPVVNGYAGYNPPFIDVLRTALDYGDVGALQALGAPLTVVVDPRIDYRNWRQFVPLIDAALVDPESGKRIFTMPAPGVEPEDPGERLTIQSATASAPVDVAALKDGDLFSHWDSQSPQEGREWIAFDLGDVREAHGLMLAVGPAYGEQAREIAIDVSTDGERWTTVFQEMGGRAAVRGAMAEPILRPATYVFPPAAARWIRARQVGNVGRFHWSICEAAVFGR